MMGNLLTIHTVKIDNVREHRYFFLIDDGILKGVVFGFIVKNSLQERGTLNAKAYTKKTQYESEAACKLNIPHERPFLFDIFNVFNSYFSSRVLTNC